jgi:prepilin-type N-terminal cleavage/methylation domain-containing protein
MRINRSENGEVARHGTVRLYREIQATQKGYTLLELLVVVGIILVLSTFGVFIYNKALSAAKETVCKTNLRALSEAVTLYLNDYDAFPASLGELKPEYIEKGYAKAREEGGWLVDLSLFLTKLDASDQAHAQFLTYENLKKYGAAEKIFSCPADPNGGCSYGINANLAGKEWSEITGSVVVVADCDEPAFQTEADLPKRHSDKALIITKDKVLGEVHVGKRVAAISPFQIEIQPVPATLAK